MSNFFNEYFNIKKMINEKRNYKKQMERVKLMPKDYQYVFKKIQEYMFKFVSGSGYDMLQIQYDLIDLFESGIENNKSVLEITGDDVARFCEDLLKTAKTYTENWKEKLNKDIIKKIKNPNNL